VCTCRNSNNNKIIFKKNATHTRVDRGGQHLFVGHLRSQAIALLGTLQNRFHVLKSREKEEEKERKKESENE
jgi:hypothetical protein